MKTGASDGNCILQTSCNCYLNQLATQLKNLAMTPGFSAGAVVPASTIAEVPSLTTMVPTWAAVVGLGVAAVTRLVAACVNSAPA